MNTSGKNAYYDYKDEPLTVANHFVDETSGVDEEWYHDSIKRSNCFYKGLKSAKTIISIQSTASRFPAYNSETKQSITMIPRSNYFSVNGIQYKV
jgi:hypothetical protein